MQFTLNTDDLELDLRLTFKQSSVLLLMLSDYMNDETDSVVVRAILTKLIRELKLTVQEAYENINATTDNNEKGKIEYAPK